MHRKTDLHHAFLAPPRRPSAKSDLQKTFASACNLTASRLRLFTYYRSSVLASLTPLSLLAVPQNGQRPMAPGMLALQEVGQIFPKFTGRFEGSFPGMGSSLPSQTQGYPPMMQPSRVSGSSHFAGQQYQQQQQQQGDDLQRQLHTPASLNMPLGSAFPAYATPQLTESPASSSVHGSNKAYNQPLPTTASEHTFSLDPNLARPGSSTSTSGQLKDVNFAHALASASTSTSTENQSHSQGQAQAQSQGQRQAETDYAYSLPFQAMMSLSESMFQQQSDDTTSPIDTSKIFDSATWWVRGVTVWLPSNFRSIRLTHDLWCCAIAGI